MWSVNKGKIKFVSFILLIVASFGMSGCSNEKQTITVFAASSLTESVKEIRETYIKEQTDKNVELNLDSSSRLRLQIEQGMKAQIYLSANKKHYDILKEKGMIASGKYFLSNSMVLIVPSDNPAKIEKLEDLGKACKFVIAQKEVPAGNYALQILDKLNNKFGNNYKEKVLTNVVSKENNVKQVVAKIVLGEADAAFVYSSDVTLEIKEKVKVIEIPKEYNVNASYWAAILKTAENNDDVKELYDMLTEEMCQNIFNKYGFEKL